MPKPSHVDLVVDNETAEPAVTVRVTPPSERFTRADYERVRAELEAQGLDVPAGGHLLHVCTEGDDGSLVILDLCRTRAEADALCDAVRAALRKLGMDTAPIEDHLTMQTVQVARVASEATLSGGFSEAELLHRVSEMAADTNSTDEALQQVLDLVCETTGWPVGHAYVASLDGPQLMVPSNLWHIDDPEAFASFKEVTERTNFHIGDGLPGQVVESGRAAWIVDVHQDENFHRAKLVTRRAAHGAFAFPVIVKGAAVAVLEFFSSEAMKPDPRLLGVMQNVGEQLGRVFERRESIDRLRAHQDRLSELSTPVVEIDKGILLLPVVGVIDSKRAREIMDAVLTQIQTVQPEGFILDISGVAVVDTAVAKHLINVTRATQLMGCETVISGLSPAIAITLVTLGVDTQGIQTTATLRSALQSFRQKIAR